MKVAITGAEGFIGKSVVSLFQKKGHDVTILNRAKEDILQPGSLEIFLDGQDVIVHLAGVNRAKDNTLMRVNAQGTKLLLEAVEKYNPQAKVIFASSSQVYLPESIYGISKKKAEEYMEKYAKEKNIKSFSLRIANVYGPNGKPFYNSVIATFIHQIKKGDGITINGSGEQKKDFIFVEDVADAFLKLAEENIHSHFETFDICTGIQTSVKEIASRLIEVSKKNIKINFVKSKIVYNVEDSKSFEKAYKFFGWRPKTEIMEGLKISYDKTKN